MSISLCVCVTGMQNSKTKEKPVIDPGSTTVLPHPDKGKTMETSRRLRLHTHTNKTTHFNLYP